MIDMMGIEGMEWRDHALIDTFYIYTGIAQ